MRQPRDKIRAREAQCLTLRAQGKTLDAIAEELGYANASGVAKALDRVLSRQAAASADTLKAMADAELDDLQRKLHALLDVPGTNIDQAVKVIDQVRKIQERRARLHGLDAGRAGAQSGTLAATDPGVRPNDWTAQREYDLVVVGDRVPKRLIPWSRLVLNPAPGTGTLPPPVPSVVMLPEVMGPGPTRYILTTGGFELGGIRYSIPEEHIPAELLDALCTPLTPSGAARRHAAPSHTANSLGQNLDQS